MINLAILYVEYDKKKYPNSLMRLQKCLDKIRANKRLCVIDNSSDDDREELGNNFVKISGDNSNWEFSGWQKGINYLNKNNVDYDIVLFVNDSFQSYGANFIEKYTIEPFIEKAVGNNFCFGEVNNGYLKRNSGFQIYDYEFDSWMRTNAFFIPKTIIKPLGNLCTIDNYKINDFISDEASSPYFLETAPMNEALKVHILDWLTDKWHGKFDLKSNWNLFRLKTKSILNEKLLSARIIKEKFDIVDIASLINLGK
jgi:hypothetical protein